MPKKELVLVKTGGKVLYDPCLRDLLLDGFASITGPKILVHGGGKKASEIANALGIAAPMIDGRRITSAEMLEVALMVYGGLSNKQLVAALQARKLNALGLSGADLNMVLAHKRPVKKVDYGFAGEIDQVNVDMLVQLIEAGIVPVLAPLSHDGQGQMLNTNADTIAACTAEALTKHYAVHLIFCFEQKGLLMDTVDDSSLIPQLNVPMIQQYQSQGRIHGGMLPKLHNAANALKAGVQAVYLCHPEALPHIHKADFQGTRILKA